MKFTAAKQHWVEKKPQCFPRHAQISQNRQENKKKEKTTVGIGIVRKTAPMKERAVPRACMGSSRTNFQRRFMQGLYRFGLKAPDINLDEADRLAVGFKRTP